MLSYLLMTTRILPLSLIYLTAAALAAGAQAPDASPAVKLDPPLQIVTLPLWPSATQDSSQTEATLTVFPPTLEASVGTAIIVAPGGAYRFLSSNTEGRQVADWFASRGVTAFVLKYRVGSSNVFPIPLQDMQQAIRVVRSLQKKYRFSDDRVGVIGFSAGGHLAAVASTTFDKGDPSSKDPLLQLSDEPNFVVLAYPALNAMKPQQDGTIGYCTMLRIPQDNCRDFDQRFTPARNVSSATPPTFIFSTSDDALVPVEASVSYYTALQKAGVVAELHIFKHGAHGSGLGGPDSALSLWPLLLDQWLRGQNLLTRPPTAPRVLTTVQP
jgi:acetyl esterase/lipase